MNNSAAVSQPPLATQTAQRQSELQQSHSQELFLANLRIFSNSLSAFQQCFSDLQLHINSIRTSIDSLLLPAQTNNTTPLPAPAPEPEPESSWESDPSEDIEEEEEEAAGEEKDVQKEEYNEKVEEEVNSPHSELKSPGSELKSSRSELITPGSELKSSGSELITPGSELKSSLSELITSGSELKSSRSELKSSRSELIRPSSDLKSSRSEFITLGSELKSSRSELITPGSELKSSLSELITRGSDSDLKSSRSELKSSRSELITPGSELKSSRSELKSSRSELIRPGSDLKSSRSEFITLGSELKSCCSELEILCLTMDSHGLRKYMITHISDIHVLRVQVPKALKLSPGPASLVFKCMGKFYSKGSKSYVNNSPLIQERKAKVLLLECFLLIDDNKGVEIEKWVKEEAEQAALAWLKRINIEKGIVQAQEIDARGLLLFIGCFGIPDKFKNKNIRNLLQVSNLNWISDALRRSNVLMAKIPEIIDEMLAYNMVVKAVHIAYSVGMQDKFNPKKLLMEFLRESKSSFDKMNGSQVAHQGNIGVKRKYMNDLKSVIKCLGCHNIDPAKLLGGWQINKRIMSLENEIAEFNKQIVDQKMAQKKAGLHKRKIDETEWLSNKEVKRSHFSNPWPPQQQRGVVNHAVSNNTLLEGGGTSGHNYGYSMSPPVLHGPVAGSIHENVVGSLAGPVGGVAIGGPRAGISPSPQGGSYAGGHGGSRVDSTPRQVGSHAGQLYGSCGNAYRPVTYMESSKGLPNTVPRDANRRSPHLGGSMELPNTIHGDAYRPPPQLEVSSGLSNTITGNAYRPVPYMESSKGLPNPIPGDAYRPPPHLEGSTGLPNIIPPPYQFAGTVPATELNQSSGSQAVDAHPTSSLHRQI
ncbi:FRIGIDA-like protein 4a isoform X2 [Lycium ferocissimum]|uniref:FRIGIDA-like protein 4a isoform X2 n=1 Tax=Lycium ferocissimum TaxID=112874 RepID=UPI0028164DBE|nr:FRIGIDA-like protein 4a isoform X2 [Lycium ferocissimum]